MNRSRTFCLALLLAGLVPAAAAAQLAAGGFAHGQHIVHDGEHNAPLCNLFVTLLHGMGVETDAFGQSTGALTWS